MNSNFRFIFFDSYTFRLDYLRVAVETIRNFIKKFSEKRGDYLNLVIAHNDITLILLKILYVQLKTPQQLLDCVISTSGFKNLDESLNEVKIRVLKIFNELWIFSVTKKNSISLIAASQFRALMQTTLNFNLSTIIKFCKSESFDLSRMLMVSTFG